MSAPRDGNFQDWNPVVIRTRQTKEEAARTGNTTTVSRYGAGKNQQASTSHAVDDGDVHAPQKTTLEMKQQIQEGRRKKNWKQKDLANACNLPVSVVQAYENGTAPYKGDEVNKIARALGIKVTRPKKKASDK